MIVVIFYSKPKHSEFAVQLAKQQHPKGMENIFQMNGCNYAINKLPPEGRQLLSLINEAQQELIRINTQKALLDAAQQQLISQLKAFLPSAEIPNQPIGADGILGSTSLDIPKTPVVKPSEEPAKFPQKIPNDIQAL